MNNNRGNNRRRGRGSNRPQGGGQVNRIDSRARGNAPQLLEKYRKLAQDAQLNGDRVQAEYYLQFADHYFRVLADSRPPKDDMRPRRDGERPTDSAGEEYDEDQGDRASPDDREEGTGNAESADTSSDTEADAGTDMNPGTPVQAYEPPENPFIRPNRTERSPRTRRDIVRTRETRAPSGDDAAGASRNGGRAGGKNAPEDTDDVVVFDPSILPPSIGTSVSEQAAPAETEEAPKPKRRTRRPKAAEAETASEDGVLREASQA